MMSLSDVLLMLIKVCCIMEHASFNKIWIHKVFEQKTTECFFNYRILDEFTKSGFFLIRNY